MSTDKVIGGENLKSNEQNVSSKNNRLLLFADYEIVA
jgi:hypothetical protein